MFMSDNPQTTKPHRVQRKRVKGWKMPPNTIYVGRPTKWGNPFVIGEKFARTKTTPGGGEISGVVEDNEHAVRLYQRFISLELCVTAKIELRGKNLACWCSLGKACHADILLEKANVRY